MSIIFPTDIIRRIQLFMSGNENFPFIKKDELTSIFFLYGKRTGISGQYETSQAYDLAERTATNLDRYIKSLSHRRDVKLDTEFLRCQFVNRALQLVGGTKQPISNDRACHDPVILSNCFATHISFYNHDYFFQLYGPLLREQVIVSARELLVGRIVLIGYNRKEAKDLPYPSPLSPLYVYIATLYGLSAP